MPAHPTNPLDASTRAGLVAALALSIFVGSTVLATGQVANNATGEATSPTLSNLSASLHEKYPSLRALVIARGNCVAFEHYGKNIGMETQSPMYSVTKSVLSILVGIAIDEGYLHPNERLFEIFPEEFDEFTDPRARDITVRDVLTKTEGFAENSWGEFNMGPRASGKAQLWRWMLNRRVVHPAGTRFSYDNVGSDLLSVVLSRAIKQRAADYAKRKLFEPLRIDNYTWLSDSEGHLHGEIGLNITARDMAKIGILYLQHGQWDGKQIVSDPYVRESISMHNSGGPPLNASYGYQWWVSKNPAGINAYFAAGYRGQLIYVVPEQNLVIAVAADSIPGGSQKLIHDVALPAAAQLPATAPCIVQLGR
ncbi:MAG TPA: serine hydrolase [Bradyrhizobium sp.]|nr:serine hydrolase [Bradyrhizobium sp.]